MNDILQQIFEVLVRVSELTPPDLVLKKIV